MKPLLVSLVLAFALTGCIAGPSCGSEVDGPGAASITFTSVPKLGSTDSLSGTVAHVIPATHYLAVVIHVPNSGWWTKPTFAEPATEIHCDGSWTAQVVSGGYDETADRLVVFLLPKDVTPPLLSGAAALPQSLYTNALAVQSVSR